jgi:hypothetical protein
MENRSALAWLVGHTQKWRKLQNLETFLCYWDLSLFSTINESKIDVYVMVNCCQHEQFLLPTVIFKCFRHPRNECKNQIHDLNNMRKTILDNVLHTKTFLSTKAG